MRAFVTGAGRGIGASIARKLTEDGWDVVVAARTRAQVDAIAAETGGRAVALDVTDRAAVERAVAEAEPVELLVANAGTAGERAPTWEIDPADWWRVFEVNVLGVHLCCRAVIPGMLERGSGRIVITGSGAAYLPPGGESHTAYPSSKAAVCRYGETLAAELAGRIPVFFFSPGLVQTELTSWAPRRRTVDTAGAGPAAGRRPRHRQVRRARRPLPARRARRPRRRAREDRRCARARSERDPAAAVVAARLAVARDSADAVRSSRRGRPRTSAAARLPAGVHHPGLERRRRRRPRSRRTGCTVGRTCRVRSGQPDRDRRIGRGGVGAVRHPGSTTSDRARGSSPSPSSCSRCT